MTRPDENKDKASFELSDEELKKIVAEADTGGRKPTGLTAQLLLVVALAWSLFQLWIASPAALLARRVRVQRHRVARHPPRLRSLPRLRRLPGVQGLAARPRTRRQDWVFAAVGAFCAAYLFMFYRSSRNARACPPTWTWPPPWSACCCCSRPRGARSACRW